MKTYIYLFIVVEGIGGPCTMGQNGDKMPDFWIFQFWGEDGRYIKIAETEDMNTVRTSRPRY